MPYAKTDGYIVRLADQLWIPMDPYNMDYQTFLQYLVDNNLTINDIPDFNG